MLSGGSEGEPVPCLSPATSSRPAVAFLGSHPRHPSLRLCHRTALSPGFLAPSLKRCQGSALGPTQILHNLIVITSAQTLFPKMVLFTGTGGLRHYHLGGDTIWGTDSAELLNGNSTAVGRCVGAGPPTWTMQAPHRAGLGGRTVHLQAEAGGGARLGQLRCGGRQARRGRPGGPPRMRGQGKGHWSWPLGAFISAYGRA